MSEFGVAKNMCVGFEIRVDYMTRYEDVIWMTYAVISFLRSLARWGSPGLSLASGFEHPC